MPVKPATLRRSFNALASWSVDMEINRGCHFWHWEKAKSRLEPAASDATANRSGYRSIMERVLVPMEPVEPRMQMCFNGKLAHFKTLLNPLSVPQGRCSQ